jgi:hypothetical protein
MIFGQPSLKPLASGDIVPPAIVVVAAARWVSPTIAEVLNATESRS